MIKNSLLTDQDINFMPGRPPSRIVLTYVTESSEKGTFFRVRLKSEQIKGKGFFFFLLKWGIRVSFK